MTIDATEIARAVTLRRIIVATTVLAGLSAAVGAPTAVRTFLALTFLAFCPGAAWVGWFGLTSAWDRVALAIGLSVAATVLVAEVLALAGALNVGQVYAILAVITICGVVAQPQGQRSGANDPNRSKAQ